MRAVIFALACTGTEAPAETPAVVEARDTGSPIDWSATEVPAEYELADLDAIVTSIMTEGLESPPDFVSWWEAMYDDLATSGNAGCPIPRDRLTEADGTTVADWYGPCDGERYSLYGFWNALLYTIRIDGYDADVHELAFSLDGTVDGDGVVHAGGRVMVVKAPILGGGWNFTVEIAGAFVDEGQDDALGDGVGMALDWAGLWSDALGFDGTMEGPVSGPAGAISFDGLVFDHLVGPGPTGAIRVRDPSSGWWEVALADDGSGCGTATWAGAEIGESCVGLALAEALDGQLASWESE